MKNVQGKKEKEEFFTMKVWLVRIRDEIHPCPVLSKEEYLKKKIKILHKDITMKMSYKNKRIATLKRVIRNNVVDGREQLVPEATCGLEVAIIFVVVVSAVAEGLAVLDEEGA